MPGCLTAERVSSEIVGGVPDAPSALTATVVNGTVTLTWAGPPAADAVTAFIIEAGSSPGATNLASLNTFSPATSFAAAGVPTGTYFVRVRAANAIGTGPASNEVAVIVGGSGCSLPGAPASLAILSNSGGTVVLAWQAAPGAPDTYLVEAGSGPGLANIASSTVGAVTTVSVPNVAGGTYYVRVRGRNSCGTGAPSNEVVLVVGGGLPTTTTRTFVVTCTSNGQVCSPLYSTAIVVQQTSNLQVEYVTAATHCASGRYSFFVDGVLKMTTPVLGFPSVRSGTLDLGAVGTGTHTLSAQAEGVLGGCNVGRVESWGGTLLITLRPL